MARRFAVSVLLAVLVVLAGCSQLASNPNEPTETATAAGANTTNTTPTETSRTPTTTAVATPSPTVTPSQTPTSTATPTPTPTPTPTATATPLPTPTPTATPIATQTPSPTQSPTVTSSPTPALEPRFVVIIGGEPDDKVNYRLTVTGSIERRGQSYGAPIADADVTEDPAIDIISGSTVAGRLGGGGDAYRITGEIVSFESEDEDAVAVYIDGELADFEDEEAFDG